MNFEKLEKDLLNAGLVLRWKDFNDLEKLFLNKRVCIIEDQDQLKIIAFLGLWPAVIHNCVEIGTFWVDAGYTGKGMGRNIFVQACQIITQNNLQSFLITDNPAIIYLAKNYGWLEESDKKIANKIRYSLKPNRRLFYFDDKSQIVIRKFYK